MSVSVDQAHAIYALVDPETQKVRYIGKSKQPEERYRQHIRKAPAWIKEILEKGLKPEQIILESGLNSEEAGKREEYWIRWYESKNNPLENFQYNEYALRERDEARELHERLVAEFSYLPEEEMHQVVAMTEYGYECVGACAWESAFQVARYTVKMLEKSPGLPRRISEPEIAGLVLQMYGEKWEEGEQG